MRVSHSIKFEAMGRGDLLIDLISSAYAGLQMAERAKLLFDNFEPGNLAATVERCNEIRGEHWEVPRIVFDFYDLETPGQVRRSCIELAGRAIADAVLLGLVPAGAYHVPADLPIDRVCEISGLMANLIWLGSSRLLDDANFNGSNGLGLNKMKFNEDKNSSGSNTNKRKVGKNESNYTTDRQRVRR